MSGAIPPFPNTPSWRGAQLKAQGQLYLYLYGSRLVRFPSPLKRLEEKYPPPILLNGESIILLVLTILFVNYTPQTF
jgi:hypothetical protein